MLRSTYRYLVKRMPDPNRSRLLQLATERPRCGYRRLHHLLRREKWVVNHKRVYRLYRAEGLFVRRRRRKRLAAAQRKQLVAPSAPNQEWEARSDGV